MAGLLGLCVLFYFGTIRDVNPGRQSVLDENVEVALVVQSRSAGGMESTVVLPVKDDPSQPDDDDSSPADVHWVTAEAQVSIEESLYLDGL